MMCIPCRAVAAAAAVAAAVAVRVDVLAGLGLDLALEHNLFRDDRIGDNFAAATVQHPHAALRQPRPCSLQTGASANF